MEKYIFPPSFDFINNPIDEVNPIAMYIFEFSHTLSQQDLADIWQNLPPDISSTMEESEVAITHPLLKKELLGEGGQSGNTLIDMPNELRWMVFKVKQRAAANYFKKTVTKNSEVNTDVKSSNVTVDEFGDTSAIQYNWPYDFFSLVELVKIDAEVEFGNFRDEDIANYTDSIPDYESVEADRDKIEYIVGGLEDDPIPEVEIPEPSIQDGITVTTEVFAGSGLGGANAIQNMLRDADDAAENEALAQGQQNIEQRKQAMIAKRKDWMSRFRSAYTKAYNDARGTKKSKRAKAYAAANVSMGEASYAVDSRKEILIPLGSTYGTKYANGKWEFTFGDGFWDNSLGLPQVLRYGGN